MLVRACVKVLSFLAVVPSVMASNTYICTMNRLEVRSQGGGSKQPTYHSKADVLVVNLRDRAVNVAPVFESKDAWTKAHARYNEIAQAVKAQIASQWCDSSSEIAAQHLFATQDDIWAGRPAPESVTFQANIFHAETDVTLHAQNLSLKSTFCTSHAGDITLRAPDESSGWLRAITFKSSASGQRPFDMMFQGTVSFTPPSIENLVVVGASKVTFEVDPHD
ncbi:MAG: hypothetical protein C0514_05030 [Candidatus Puniceispirillum sp.]|nr:hypothetical protein [Candidatus Puniceispirillum sp.]